MLAIDVVNSRRPGCRGVVKVALAVVVVVVMDLGRMRATGFELEVGVRRDGDAIFLFCAKERREG